MEYLGEMEYLLVASPSFVKKYFSNGTMKQNLLSAPALKYDRNDDLYERYLEKHFDLHSRSLNFHTLPSVKGFKTCALLGIGCALIPKLDVIDELKKGSLVQVSKTKTWKVPLYWHYWSLESKKYQMFNSKLTKKVKKLLEIDR